MSKKGIDEYELSEILEDSGIFYNKDINWIVFHGGFDLGYMIKLLKNKKLPEKIEDFNRIRLKVFPVVFDIKVFLFQEKKLRNRSLQKIAEFFYLEEEESYHQAGLDSLVTIKVYFKILEEIYKEKPIDRYTNKIYAITDY